MVAYRNDLYSLENVNEWYCILFKAAFYSNNSFYSTDSLRTYIFYILYVYIHKAASLKLAL